MASKASPKAAAWAVSKGRATLKVFGGELVIDRQDGRLTGVWTGPVPAETSEQALEPIEAMLAAAKTRGVEDEALELIEEKRQAIADGPEEIRKANPELTIRVGLHGPHPESAIEAMNACPVYVLDSLRQTHPGFFRSLLETKRPVAYTADKEPF